MKRFFLIILRRVSFIHRAFLSFYYYYRYSLFFILRKHIKLENKRPILQQPLILSGEGKIIIKENCKFGYLNGGFNLGGSISLDARTDNSLIVIDQNVTFNNNVFISSANLIEIGQNTLVGQNVNIMDYEAHGIEPEARNQIGVIGSIKIGKNVWIGTNVIILKNTVIGDNCVIAAGAVVSGNFDRNLIIGGVPAKVIKSI